MLYFSIFKGILFNLYHCTNGLLKNMFIYPNIIINHQTWEPSGDFLHYILYGNRDHDTLKIIHLSAISRLIKLILNSDTTFSTPDAGDSCATT